MSSIIKRALNTRTSPLNIIMGSCEDSSFIIFLQDKALTIGTRVLPFNDPLIVSSPIDLVICNSRITQFDRCFNVSNFFQCPMIIIDHDSMPTLIDPKVKTDRAVFPHIIQIARSKEIYDSWGAYHDLILDYEFYNKNNANDWGDLIYKVSKINFHISNKLGVK